MEAEQDDEDDREDMEENMVDMEESEGEDDREVRMEFRRRTRSLWGGRLKIEGFKETFSYRIIGAP